MHFNLNVKKTEEMRFNPRMVGDHSPVVIHNTLKNQVCCKYIGVHIDNMFTWQGDSTPPVAFIRWQTTEYPSGNSII